MNTRVYKKYEIENKIYQTNDLTPKAKQVFNYLNFRANKETLSCFPGLKKIAKECAISISTVQRALKELIEEGYVEKKANYRENGGQTSNIYRIIVDIREKEEIKRVNIAAYISILKSMEKALILEINKNIANKDLVSASKLSKDISLIKMNLLFLSNIKSFLDIKCDILRIFVRTIETKHSAIFSRLTRGDSHSDYPINQLI